MSGEVQPLHLGRVLHLRQHDAVQVGAGTLDDLDDVAIGPVRGHVVHPDDADAVSPAAFVQRGDDVLAGGGFDERRARILEIEEHLVSRQ